MNDEVLLARVEERLKSYKQWKDQYGLTWIEINGKKFPKSQLVNVCLDEERKLAQENPFYCISL